ncbi:Cytochrome c1-1 [Hibiscus syriacus]|uniref:Cytochrome c1-1 n=1 Tax=Hibiscus syriacus TaxID=106335 RepID=A0A6A3BTV5_HIBSY|nr:Cytochrome c1-1 [Hibiscus syriacus]
MRLMKGSKVEVLTKQEIPTGAWRCAEIISGNGRTYSIRCGWFPVTGEAGTVERVSRKAIRPCPPPTNGTYDWVPSDVLEVFDELCWKPAVVVWVFGGNKFSVRIIGSSRELEVHRSRLRVRQSWEDGKWFLVGKGSSNSSSKRKRSSLGFSDDGGWKKRAIENGSVNGKRIIVRLPSPAFEKVDAFVSPNNILGERCTPSCLYRIDSCASSVGSCSGLGNNGLNLSPAYVTNGCENLEDYCSDADSSCERRCGEEGSSGFTSEGMGMDFHRLELHAYQQVLEALYVSGPLTWEEEAKQYLGNVLMISQSISLSLLEAFIHSFKSHDWV